MMSSSLTPSYLFRQVTIIGVGLLGGSLGLVLRERGLAEAVVGVGRSRSNLELAVQIGAIDQFVCDAKEAVGSSDLIILATPVETYVSQVHAWGGCLRPGTIVSDVGSVKGPLVFAMDSQLPPSVHFVGAHPIAGKEKSGVAFAESRLFQGARCIITPTPRTQPQALQKIREMWEAAGSMVLSMKPDDHDWILGAVSHLPHVAAFALMHTLQSLQEETPGTVDLLAFSGGGLRDTTRIAASSPEMWRDICFANRVNLDRMIDQYIRHLEAFRHMLQGNDIQGLQTLLEQSKALRERLK